jgi:hypothetical protein
MGLTNRLWSRKMPLRRTSSQVEIQYSIVMPLPRACMGLSKPRCMRRGTLSPITTYGLQTVSHPSRSFSNTFSSLPDHMLSLLSV